MKKISILLLVVSTQTFACAPELCFRDASKLEVAKFGTIRPETFQAIFEQEGSGHYPAPIVCRFTYVSDVSYRGGNFVVAMKGNSSYEPVTCKHIDTNSTYQD